MSEEEFTRRVDEIADEYEIRADSSRRKLELTHWEYIGHSRKCIRPFKNKSLPINPMVLGLLNESHELRELAEKYDRVQRTQDRYEKSILKGDKPLMKPTNGDFEQSIQYATKYLGFMYSKPGCISRVNRTAASGRLAGFHGKQTKGDVIDDEAYFRRGMADMTRPVYSGQDKDEILSRHDIDNREKLRTYFSLCVFGIMWQKYFFSGQNKLLKTVNTWLQYGFVKQHGGFNDLIQQLNAYDYRFCGDKSGWDRVFPLLREVYRLRSQLIKDLSPNATKMLNRVIDWIVYHVVVLKDGHMYMKEIGNPSGSNNTTEDNCIGHLIIHIYLFIKLWRYFHNKLPEIEIVFEHAWVNIYGDDDFGGYKVEEFTYDRDEFNCVFKDMYYKVFGEFGMEIKFYEYESTSEPIKCVTKGGMLEFLGSRPLLLGGMYIPKPNCSHLATSLISNLGDKSTTSVVSKIKAALDLCLVGAKIDREMQVICDFAYGMAEVYINEPGLSDPDRFFLMDVNRRRYNPFTLVTGLESGGKGYIYGASAFFSSPQGGRRNKNKYYCNTMEKRLNNMTREARSRGQTINKLQNDVTRMKKFAGHQKSPCEISPETVTRYVQSIVDPEEVGAHRYPDHFAEDTATLLGIINFKLPVLTLEGVTEEVRGVTAGDYYAESHPELNNQVIYLTEDKAGERMSGILTQQSNNFGLFDLENNFSGSPSNMFLVDDKVKHVAMPLFDSQGTMTVPRLLGPDQTNVTTKGFWYPGMDFEGPTQLTVIIRNTALAAFDFTLNIVRADGSVPTSATTVTVPGLQDALVNVTAGSFATDEGLASFRMETFINNFATDTPPSCWIQNITLTGESKSIGWRSEEIPDIETIGKDAEKYRVTALSMWMQYQGSTLTDGGESAMVMYRGGKPSGYNQVWDYQSIAEHPESYSGKVKDGLYGYWEPQDTVDMSYRSTTAVNEFRRPYLICAGTYSGDPTTGAINNPFGLLRLRVVCSYEYTSRSQLFNNSPAPICPKLITLGSLALQGQPNVMENSRHKGILRRISNFMSRAGKSAVKWGWEHPDTVRQVATTIGTGLMALF